MHACPSSFNSLEEAQITSINPLSYAVSSQQPTPMSASNRFSGLEVNEGQLIVEFSSNTELPKEGLGDLNKPLGSGAKKKFHLGSLELHEQLKLKK